ncbi:hypothetical protein P5V15_000733 [Pogonomyrmex californicus]
MAILIPSDLHGFKGYLSTLLDENFNAPFVGANEFAGASAVLVERADDQEERDVVYLRGYADTKCVTIYTSWLLKYRAILT